METSFTIARIAGIRIGANWTWLFVLALVIWSLGSFVFPDQNPEVGTAGHWAMAAVAAALFFASVLAHELGHALRARREGVDIDEITLWLFGGVAKLRGTYTTAGAEFRIAVAGPAVTLVIAAALVTLALLVPLPSSVDGVVTWLGRINLLLLGFNLLPALPLDGGRILHAALWRARDDLVWATRVGTRIGQAFGALMIVGGVLLFFAGAYVSGIWLSFVGWFLIGAAQAEAAQVLVRERLAGVRVRDLMVGEPATVERDVTVGQFMDTVARRSRYTTYPVVAGARALGLLPFRCVAEVPREAWDERRVGDCMLARDEVVVTSPTAYVRDVLPALASSGTARALVEDDGALVGLLSLTDVARRLERLSRGAGGDPARGNGEGGPGLRDRAGR